MLVQQNNANSAGKIFNINSGTTVRISNLTLTNGLVTGSGGAINNAGTLTITGCNILNNAATVSGGSIYNTGTLTLNFNRIIGTGNVIASPSGSVNAKINWWWGSNSSPSGKVLGNVDVSTWLVLTISASPTSITTSGTSNITADITHDQNGTYYNPTNGHVPDGISISFTSTLGTVNPITATLTNGMASTTFTAKTPGLAKINSTVDGYSNAANVSVGSANLTIWVYDMNGLTNWFYGSSPEYIIELYNAGPNDAHNVTVTITLPNGLILNGYNPRSNGNVTVVGNILTWNVGYLCNNGYTAMDLLARLNQTGTVTIAQM